MQGACSSSALLRHAPLLALLCRLVRVVDVDKRHPYKRQFLATLQSGNGQNKINKSLNYKLSSIFIKIKHGK